MKSMILLPLALTASIAFAKGNKLDQNGFDYPQDVSDKCADAIYTAMDQDQYLTDYIGQENYSQSLEWDQKTTLALNIQFDQDVRDGYVTATLTIEKQGDTCKVVKIEDESVGD
jgi:hypothetical protein